jgi:hypothetical protein
MMIRKGKYKENYAVIPNSLAQHRGMSFEARGMLLYLLSKPGEWIVQETDLKREAEIGTHRVRRIIRELIEIGYLQKARRRKDDGTYMAVEYEVFPKPQPSIVQKSTVDNSSTDNQPHIKDRAIENTEQQYIDCRSGGSRQKTTNKQKSHLSKNWQPNRRQIDFCQQHGYDADEVAVDFVDHNLANGIPIADVDAAWEKFVTGREDYLSMFQTTASNRQKASNHDVI